MKKSTQVTLTILASVGCAAQAQQPSNPCAPGTINPAACRTAPRVRGLCNGGVWVHQQSTAGGVVTAPMGTCRTVHMGGFGATGAASHARSGS